MIYRKLMQAAGAGVEPVSPYSIDTRASVGGLRLLDIPSAVFGLNDFTYEAWIYLEALAGTWNGIIGNDNSNGMLFAKNAGDLEFFDSGTRVASPDGALVVDTWYHVAAVRVGGTSTTIYIDGVEVGSDPWAEEVVQNDIHIGSSNLSGERLDGYIFRPHVLASAKYTSNFTPQTNYVVEASSVVLVEANESGFVDLCGNTITDFGTPPVPALFSPL